MIGPIGPLGPGSVGGAGPGLPDLDLGGLGVKRGQRVFDDTLVAREAAPGRTATAGVAAAALLVCVPLLLVMLNALLGASLGFYRQEGFGPLAAAARAAGGYSLAVGPWLPLAAASGAALGWLRRFSARRGQWWIVPLSADTGLRFGWHSIAAGVLVPVALLIVAGRTDLGDRAVLLMMIIFPAWLLSGLAVEALWELLTVPLLRRLAPVSPARYLEVGVRALVQMEPDLESVKLRSVRADPEAGVLYVQGVFADEGQVARLEEVCRQRIVGVRRVEIGEARSDEASLEPDARRNSQS